MNNLQIQNLSKTYPNGVKALQNVSLSISNGMFGLLGANGAGKSSLMKTIASLQEPSEGTIFFNQTDIIKKPIAIRKCLGYLPQQFNVYPKVSAEKLLDHIAILKGVTDTKKRKQQVDALLQQTNLYQHRKKAVYTYSGGMKQRFGIAQALLANPKVIIVDEPTAGLDPEERNRFLNLLSEIGENVIVILSTHIVEDVYGLCANMAILDEGKIVKQGSPQTLVADLKDQIWTKTIDKNSLEEYQKQHNVVSTKLVSGKTQIRVLSSALPANGFALVAANLEDVYFTSMGKSLTISNQ
ncbi:MAG: ABC transporter ATP-binding protein [Crocinitomicaceae bacterium]|nr:ABC transporter ATP-binding protein [Flavobacteriales bacterium]NQZ34113.1 ABC transporter ATP-binding protein [Crocinitomicaceae bacterium]